MNCPACGYYNPDGARACFHCSLVLPLPAGDALCPKHPDTRATGACNRCGTFGCAQCLTQSGTDWLCAACLARQSVLPWDERATLGVWRAWWRTSVLMVSQPMKTCEGAQPEAPLGSSLFFATLSTLVGMGPTIVVYALILIPAMLLSSPKERSAEFPVLLVPLFGVLYVVFLLAMQVASVLVISGLDHLGLMLVGANPRSYTVTVRAYALSMGSYVVGVVPVCGLYVFPLWSMVLRIIANMHLHKTSGGKATAAVLLPLVVCCGGIFTVYALIIGLAGAARG